MMNKLRALAHMLFGRQNDFRVRLFNILAVTGMCTGLIGCLLSRLNHEPVTSSMANLASSLLSVHLVYSGYKTRDYRRCFLVTIIGVFFVVFPVIYITGGAFSGAMPFFFVFAIVFTVFMLADKLGAILALAELGVYMALCLVSYFFPQYFVFHMDRATIFLEVFMGFALVSVGLGVTLMLHIRLFNQQERLLAAQNASLSEINNLKTEFLANVSHELKTPLTVISTHAQLSASHLGELELDEDYTRMRLIASETERMGLMVSQLLDVTRIEEGHTMCNLKPNSLSEVVETTLSTYFPVLRKNNNVLRFQRLADLPPIMLDRFRMEQVIVNLITNAVKSTHDGEIRVEIAQQEPDSVQVRVSDSGEGMSPQLLERLFQRFTQKETRTTTDTGTGLGLYICKHIVEEHGGKIWAESEPGKGTVITFTLPV